MPPERHKACVSGLVDYIWLYSFPNTLNAITIRLASELNNQITTTLKQIRVSPFSEC